MLHGFSILERAGGFQIDIDEIFTWMITFVDLGLQMATSIPGPQRPRADKQ